MRHAPIPALVHYVLPDVTVHHPNYYGQFTLFMLFGFDGVVTQFTFDGRPSKDTGIIAVIQAVIGSLSIGASCNFIP